MKRALGSMCLYGSPFFFHLFFALVTGSKDGI